METHCTVSLHFTHATTAYEKVCNHLVRAHAGNPHPCQPIRVSISVSCDQDCDMNNVFFTTYAGGEFSMVPRSSSYTWCEEDCTVHSTMTMPICNDEYHAFCHCLMKLVQRGVQYNRSDLALLILPGPTFVDTMFPDNCVGSELHTTPKLYCSQAALVIMRECLCIDYHPVLVPLLHMCNSRCVSPSKLMCMMHPHMTHLTCVDSI
jgi:hypothetical protein